MKERLKKLLPTTSTIKMNSKYFILGAVVFAVGFVWHFPMQSINQSLLKTLQKHSGADFSVGKISFVFPLGIKATKVTLLHMPQVPLPLPMELDEAKLTLSPISAVRLALSQQGSVGFYFKQGTGEIQGSIFLGGANISLKVDVNNLLLDQVMALGDAMPGNINIKAKVKGKLHFDAITAELNNGNLSSMQGTLKLWATEAVIALPAISSLSFDQIRLDLSSEKGTAILQSLTLDGPMLSGKGSGSLELRPVLERSILKMDAQLQIGKEGESLKTMLSFANIRLDDTGKGAMKITGPLNQLQMRSY